MSNIDAEIIAWLDKAGMSSSNKPDYTKLISNRKGEPTDQDLYNQVKADAQKKFDVYPSAVANGWVVQEYKRRGGTYHKPVTKGDLPGHVFHGNQYTSNPFDKGFDSERRFGAGWSALMASAHARDLAQHGATGAQIANAHRAAAFEHGIASKVLKSALAKETNPEKQGALKSAIAAHDQAAELHNWVAEQQESGTDGQIARDNTMLARGASTVATSLSRETGADTGAEFRGPSKRP